MSIKTVLKLVRKYKSYSAFYWENHSSPVYSYVLKEQLWPDLANALTYHSCNEATDEASTRVCVWFAACGFTVQTVWCVSVSVCVCETFPKPQSSTLRPSPMHGPDLQSQCLHFLYKTRQKCSWLAHISCPTLKENTTNFSAYVIFTPQVTSAPIYKNQYCLLY